MSNRNFKQNPSYYYDKKRIEIAHAADNCREVSQAGILLRESKFDTDFHVLYNTRVKSQTCRSCEATKQFVY